MSVHLDLNPQLPACFTLKIIKNPSFSSSQNVLSVFNVCLFSSQFFQRCNSRNTFLFFKKCGF